MFAKVIAALMVLYGVARSEWSMVFWAIIVWEVGGGFKTLSVFWISNFGRHHDHEDH